MPPTQSSLGGVDYSTCTLKELRTFIRSRRRRYNRFTNRQQLGNKLMQMDRACNFRFLDLAPELRNIVYRELLLIDPAEGRVDNFNILLASKETHSEAEGLLYALNTFEVQVTSKRRASDRSRFPKFHTYTAIHEGIVSETDDSKDAPLPAMTHAAGMPYTPPSARALETAAKYAALRAPEEIAGDIMAGRFEGSTYVSLEYDLLPTKTLRKIQHLRLDIGLDLYVRQQPWFPSASSRFVEVHCKLMALASALCECGHLQTVDVHFTDFSKNNDEKLRPDQLNNILSPLAKLEAKGSGSKPPRQVKFHGFPRQVQDYLHQTQLIVAMVLRPRNWDDFRTVDAIKSGVSAIRKAVLEAAETNLLLDVFLTAFDLIVAEVDLPWLVDYKTECVFRGKVESLLRVYEANIVQWRRWLWEQKLPTMRLAQERIEEKARLDENVWLSDQREAFECVMN